MRSRIATLQKQSVIVPIHYFPTWFSAVGFLFSGASCTSDGCNVLIGVDPGQALELDVDAAASVGAPSANATADDRGPLGESGLPSSSDAGSSELAEVSMASGPLRAVMGAEAGGFAEADAAPPLAAEGADGPRPDETRDAAAPGPKHGGKP
jgi:hypothetical protein